MSLSLFRSTRVGTVSALLILVPLFARMVAPLHGEPAPPPTGVSLHETTRRLVFLPLKNDTGDRDQEYLREGIPKMLLGRVDSVIYIPETRPLRLFRATPRRLNEGDEGALLRGDEGAGNGRLKLATVLARLNVKQEALMESQEWAPLSRELDGSYLVGGRYRYADSAHESVVIEMVYYDAMTGRIVRFSHTASLRYIYRNLDELADRVRSELVSVSLAPVHIETSAEGAMLYLDDQYLGRSPYDGRVIPGHYTLAVEQEGYDTYRQEVDISLSGRNYFRLDTVALRYDASLRVRSEPAGARVYLDSTFLGVTPLEAGNLEPGTHRLRVSSEGHIDGLVGVVLKGGSTKDVSVTLKEGDSQEYYGDPGYAVLDWTYHDLSFYTALSSIVFYGGWLYAGIQSDRLRDSVRPIIPSLVYSDIPTLNAYQYHLLRTTETKVGVMNRYGNVSAGMGVTALFLSGFFLWRGIVHDEKPVGEISVRFTGPGDAVRPVFAAPFVGATSARAPLSDVYGISIFFRF